MASLGELFVELGVIGDVEPLKQTREEMKKAEKEAQRLVKFIQDYNKATSDTEKKLIKENHERAINIDKLDEQIKAHEALAGKVAGFIKGAAAIVTAVTGAVFAINHMTDALFRQNQVWINLLRQTDTGLSTFQKYAGVASVLDKSLGMEGAAGSIEALNEKLFQLALTGEGANGFLLAGINPLGQTPEGIMEQLRARVSGMSDTSATYLLKQMGIDPRMLAMLRMTREEFEALNAEIKKYQLNEGQRRTIQGYQEEIAKVSMKLQYLKDRALLAILPYFTEWMKSIARVTELLARAGKKLGDFIIKFRGFIPLVMLFLSKLAPVKNFIAALKTVPEILAKIPIVGRAVSAFITGFTRALLPLMAIFLLIDDVATYMQGGDSYTGDFMNWLDLVGEELKTIANTFAVDFGKGIKELFVWLWSITDDIIGLLAGFLQFLTFGKVPFVEWLNNVRHSGTIGQYYDDIKAGNYDKLFGASSQTNQTNNNNNSKNVNINEVNINTTESASELENMWTCANIYYAGV